MSTTATLLPFPKGAVATDPAKESPMAHEISRDQISLASLCDLVQSAGFEAVLQEENVFIVGTGAGLRLEIDNAIGAIFIRALYMLNPQAADSAIAALCGKLNERLLVSKFVFHRWDDGDVGLFISCAVHYNFGLQVPNFLFVLRRFIESCQTVYRHEILDARFDPNFKPPELALVAEAQSLAPAQPACDAEPSERSESGDLADSSVPADADTDDPRCDRNACGAVTPSET
jgi:hypothetical protein